MLPFWYTLFLNKQRFFSPQFQCCFTFSRIELQMLLRCCLIHITIIILRHILYLVYLRLCPFLLCLCDLFFISSLNFIAINHITSLKQTHLFLYIFLEYLLLFLDDEINKRTRRIILKQQKFSLRVLLSFLIFCQFQPGVAYKGVPYKNIAISLSFTRIIFEGANGQFSWSFIFFSSNLL